LCRVIGSLPAFGAPLPRLLERALLRTGWLGRFSGPVFRCPPRSNPVVGRPLPLSGLIEWGCRSGLSGDRPHSRKTAEVFCIAVQLQYWHMQRAMENFNHGDGRIGQQKGFEAEMFPLIRMVAHGGVNIHSSSRTVDFEGHCFDVVSCNVERHVCH